MIIGFDGSRAFIKNRSGTENYSFQLLQALSKIDHKNSYKVYLRSQGETLRGWPSNFQFSIVNFQFLWTQGGLALQTFKDKLDVLFVPAHTLPIIRKPGLKTVVTVHDLGSEYLPKMHQLKQRLYLSFMQRMQLEGATKIIAVSKATKEDLVNKIGLDSQKIEVIYEGFDKNLFKPINYKLSTNNYFLFVGTVQPRKNLTRVIQAFSRVRDSSLITQNDKFELVIAGQKGWLSDEIYELPKKLGIKDRVKFLGYVPDEKLPKLYAGAIALIFPSLFEGFGLPILEAQACGCPVITSNISSMPEIAGKGAILVDPYDIDDIVSAMKKIEDGRLKMELVKLGLENIKRFSWEKCAKETLKIFQELGTRN